MSLSLRSPRLCVFITIISVFGFRAVAQNPPPAGVQKPNKTKAEVRPAKPKADVASKAKEDKSGVQPAPSASSAAINAAATTALNQLPAPGADYVPCRFTDAQLKSLSAPEQVLTLSANDAESLVSKVTSSIQQQQEAGLITADEERELFLEITKSTLTGLTPSEALQRIIQATLSARATVAPVVPANGSAGATPSNGVAQTQPDRLGDKGKPDPNATDQTFTLALQGMLVTPGNATQLAAPKTDSAVVTKNPVTGAPKKELTIGTETSRNMAAIVNSARDTIERLTRPADVGCAMSVLSYNETTKAFGYIIANNYIAVQVVVRNLNRDQQFVLHDVEYSVNADPAGAIGRYYSGRDKVVVRALASAEGSFDPRNLIVHTAQGIGAIMTTLVPIFGGAIGDAAAAYNGGFFPSLDKAWKDMSTDQLNLLNDTGFTSQSTSQTVVPKADKAMFITFIPSKQFERGWWTQDCVKAVPEGVINAHGVRALEPLGANSKIAANLPYTPIDEAIQACAIQAYSQLGKQQKSRIAEAFSTLSRPGPASFTAPNVTPEDIVMERAAIQRCSDLETEGRSKLNATDQADLLRCEAPAMLYANVPKRLFRHWSGNSVAIFQELSTVVIAGMHIVDDATLQPGISSIDCTKDTSGNLIFPVPDTGTIGCPIKGKNLAKVKALRLRNTDESAYTDGAVVAASGDDSTGTVSFASSSLHTFTKSEYNVFALNATNVETSTNQVLHFDLNPYLSKTDPTALDATALPVPPTMTLTGFHLDKIAEIHFYMTDATKFARFTPVSDAASNDRQIKIKLDSTEMGKIGTVAGDSKVAVLTTGNKTPIALANVLKFTPPGAVKPAAPAGPVAAAAPKAAKPAAKPGAKPVAPPPKNQ